MQPLDKTATTRKKKKLSAKCRVSWCSFYFYGAEIHEVPDAVVVVAQPQGFGVRETVEGPGGGRVLLGQHFLQDAAAVLELRAAPPPKMRVPRWADAPQAPRGSWWVTRVPRGGSLSLQSHRCLNTHAHRKTLKSSVISAWSNFEPVTQTVTHFWEALRRLFCNDGCAGGLLAEPGLSCGLSWTRARSFVLPACARHIRTKDTLQSQQSYFHKTCFCFFTFVFTYVCKLGFVDFLLFFFLFVF